MRKNKGFTLIELLIVIVIVGILSTFGVSSYRKFNQNQILKQAAFNLANDLREAQQKAMSGEKPAGCGTLSSHKLIFTSSNTYKIAAYCGSDIDIKTGLSLGANVSVSGNPSITFRVLGQGLPASQAFCLNSSYGKIYKICVTTTGEIIDGGIVVSCANTCP